MHHGSTTTAASTTIALAYTANRARTVTSQPPPHLQASAAWLQLQLAQHSCLPSSRTSLPEGAASSGHDLCEQSSTLCAGKPAELDKTTCPETFQNFQAITGNLWLWVFGRHCRTQNHTRTAQPPCLCKGLMRSSTCFPPAAGHQQSTRTSPDVYVTDTFQSPLDKILLPCGSTKALRSIKS